MSVQDIITRNMAAATRYIAPVVPRLVVAMTKEKNKKQLAYVPMLGWYVFIQDHGLWYNK